MAESWSELQKSFRRGAFSPVSDYAHRRNSKTTLIVHRDGSVTERVSLQVPDPAHREEIICRHYLRHYAVCFSDEPFGTEVLSRDKPWDFGLRLSTGEQFFVEITAIADSTYQFEKDKREERLLKAAAKSTIRLRDLRKLARDFPGLSTLEALLENARAPADREVPNPLLNSNMHAFLSHSGPSAPPLAEQVVAAINRKSAKDHAGKERTVLILDYRGNLDAAELRQEHLILAGTLGKAPFPEVWFYVGYFSDDDGNNAEFSFTPLILPDAKQERLQRFESARGVDEYGRVIW